MTWMGDRTPAENGTHKDKLPRLGTLRTVENLY